MTKCRVEKEEFEFDFNSFRPAPSIFDESDKVEPLEPETLKRGDGTYTCNPSLEGYINGTEQFMEKD